LDEDPSLFVPAPAGWTALGDPAGESSPFGISLADADLDTQETA